jgi:hypothetical protein
MESMVMVLNATSNNISVLSWPSVLLKEESGVQLLTWRAISGYTNYPRLVVWTSENDIARAGGKYLYHDPYHDPRAVCIS